MDSVNREFYNTFYDHFDKIPFEEVLTKLFLKYITKPNQILEIGSGTGALALWMTQLGHVVTCIEPAEKAAEIARKRGLKVEICNFQDFHSAQKFDSILAISSLIHIPRAEMESQIKKIAGLLNGFVFLSFIEGEGEGYEDPTGVGKERFFAKFSEAELTKMLSTYFSIIETHRIESKRMHQTFLLFVMHNP